MTTVNRSSPDYAPQGSPYYRVPVQVGSVRLLAIAATPAGQGILSWVDGTANELRCAVLPSVHNCLADDVVESGDVRTIWSSATRTLHAGVIAVINGELLAWVSHRRTVSGVENNGTVECYVANDVENPTSWSLRGTCMSHNAGITGGTCCFESPVMGPPTVLPSGRWVLPANTWETYGGSALTDAVGVYTSDNSGVTWTVRLSDRAGPLGGGNSGTLATSIAYHPGTGRLVAGRSPAGSASIATFYSSDSGSTWTKFSFTTSKGVPHFYMDNTSTLYCANDIGSVRRIYEAVDPLDDATWVDTGLNAIQIDALSEESHGFQSIPLWSGGTLMMVAFTAGNRIASSIGGWWVGQVGIG
jgi:hypothetical protein